MPRSQPRLTCFCHGDKAPVHREPVLSASEACDYGVIDEVMDRCEPSANQA